jgi:outer membrane protein OmpA-like peptidoglycan-associated protein
LKKNSWILILVFIILIITDSKAQERYTDYILFGGVSINLNIHSSKFAALPGWESCCSEFDGGIGLGPQFTLGGIYLPKSDLFGLDWRYGVSLSYSDLSATLSREEFIGYVIYDDSYTQGKSEFSLEGDISAVLLSPFINIYPLKNIPVGVNVGLEGGLLLNSGFSHEERLVSPGNATYENYKKVRQEYSGDIPDAATLYFSGLIGLQYEAYVFNNFKVVPHISFAYGLTDFTSAVDWSGNRLFAGVNIEYRIPAPEPPAPIPPPAPELPEPDQPEPLLVELKVESLPESGERKTYKNGDTLQVQAKITNTKELIALRPEIFLIDNQKDIANKGANQSLVNSILSGYNNIPVAIAESMKNDPETKIRITANFTDSKKEAEEKVNSLLSSLKNDGVDISGIAVSYNDLTEKDFRYHELEEEANNISIDFGTNDKFIYVTSYESELIDIDERKIQLIPSFNRDQVKEINYSSNIEGISDIGVLTLHVLNILPVFDKDIEIELSAEVTDLYDQKKTATTNLIITKNLETTEKINTTFEIGKKAALGYFAFDRSSFEVIDHKVLKEAKENLAKGKDLIIYAYTDNLGSDEYNDDLAQKRAKAALDLLGTDETKVVVHLHETPLFNNKSPLGRKLNRSVFIEIK